MILEMLSASRASLQPREESENSENDKRQTVQINLIKDGV